MVTSPRPTAPIKTYPWSRMGGIPPRVKTYSSDCKDFFTCLVDDIKPLTIKSC